MRSKKAQIYLLYFILAINMFSVIAGIATTYFYSPVKGIAAFIIMFFVSTALSFQYGESIIKLFSPKAD